MIGDYVGGNASGGRTYHHTAPVAMIASLHAALGRILEEGLPAVFSGTAPRAPGWPRGCAISA